MGRLGLPELLVILAIIIVIFGANRLPGLGRGIGSAIKNFKDEFKEKDIVDVIGTSKGRGFAGLVKRHHFRGGPASHGSMFHRAAGSIGASSFPSRVFPGMKMAGRMGTDQVTIRNLEIVSVDSDDNVIAVKGAIPGPNGGYVMVRRAKR